MVREAAEGDLPDLVALLAALFSIEADFDFDAAKQLSGLQQLLACASASVQVAVAAPPPEGGSGRMLGMATCQTVISTAEGGPAGVVEDVVVAQDAQGQGECARGAGDAELSPMHSMLHIPTQHKCICICICIPCTAIAHFRAQHMPPCVTCTHAGSRT